MFSAQNTQSPHVVPPPPVPPVVSSQEPQKTVPVVPPPLHSSSDLPPVISQKGSIFSGHKGRLLIPIIIIVGTMAALTYVLPSFRRQNIPVATPTPEPTLIPATPLPTLPPDPYKDWKAYVNRSAELSFKYPGNVSLKEEKLTNGVIVVTLSDTASASGTLIEIRSSQKLSTADLLNTYVGGGSAVNTDKEEDVTISGVTGKQGEFVRSSGGEGVPIQYASISRDTTNILFVNNKIEQKELFHNFLATVRLVSQGITPDWQTYSNSAGNYSLRYPPTWQISGGTATASAKTVYLRKDPSEQQFQSLTVDVQTATDKQRIDLTASEIISSLQNLAGWKDTPTLDFRSIGGGQAQIVSGEKEGSWSVYAVVWYRNTLLQLSWKDTLLRPEQNNFDDILGSIQFK